MRRVWKYYERTYCIDTDNNSVVFTARLFTNEVPQVSLFYFAMGAVAYLNATSSLPTVYKAGTYVILFALFLAHLEYKRLGALKSKYEQELLQHVRDMKEQERKELREWKEQKEIEYLKQLRDNYLNDL